MATEIKAPQFPESVTDGVIVAWHKQPGESVSRDDLLVEIETDKVVLEVVAAANGSMGEIIKNVDDTVESQEVLAILNEGAAAASQPAASQPAAAQEAVKKEEAPAKETVAAAGPAARKMMSEQGVNPQSVTGTGKGDRVTKADVQAFVNESPASANSSAPQLSVVPSAPAVSGGDREERRVPMTRLRKRVAERLLEAQQTAAQLTTFNEVNMGPVMNLRKQYKDLFEKMHGVRLGFMSFFVKAAVEALKRFPEVNASIDGDDVVYHDFFDVGVAVSSNRGLVVPVLRNVESLGAADIEKNINEYAKSAQAGKLALEDMMGGTFTISNGGVFGSLLSTPILNPPQTAILGMHKIQERPMVVNGEIKIQPMMYLALTYDHRLVDGKEAVQFLVTIKDMIEDPARLLLEV